MNLLLLHEGEKSHYCWIKNFSRLCHDKNNHDHKLHYCMRCLSSFNTTETLENHERQCKEAVVTKMPEDPILKFKNYGKSLKCPYVIYADTEAIVQKIESSSCGNTLKETQHVPCSIGFIVVRSDGLKTHEWFYRGEDCIEQFYQQLSKVRKDIYFDLRNKRRMRITSEEQQVCIKPYSIFSQTFMRCLFFSKQK